MCLSACSRFKFEIGVSVLVIKKRNVRWRTLWDRHGVPPNCSAWWHLLNARKAGYDL